MALIFTIVSAVFLALTVIADKLMIGDFYEGSRDKAWFVTSLLGSLFGLCATFTAWIVFGSPSTDELFVALLWEESGQLAVGVLLGGVLVSLMLRSYFTCMSSSVMSIMVAVAIAITPIFVFATELTLIGNAWQPLHYMSVLLAVSGFIAFEILENQGTQWRLRLNPHLIAVVAFGTAYLVLIDYTLPKIESLFAVSETQAVIAALPYYWIGFAFGTLTILRNEVRSFVLRMWRRPHFIGLVIALELTGMFFYFFEVFGLSGLTATLVALITGAHIVLVWLSDLYIRKRYLKACESGADEVTVLFFRIPTADLEEYDKSARVLNLQAFAIIVVLVGISLWPT